MYGQRIKLRISLHYPIIPEHMVSKSIGVALKILKLTGSINLLI